MTIRRVLLWGLPVVFVVSLAFFILAPPVIQRQLQTADAIRQAGWTTYLEGFVDNDAGGSPGARSADMALDRSGRVWVAGGGMALTGLHGYADTDWISHTGKYGDLAVGSQGEIWAVPLYQSGVDFFDGQQMITGQDLGLGDQQILQIEVDSNGRIWVVVGNFPSYQLAEIVIRENKATTLFSHPEFTITDGFIESLDADNEGRLWASVRSFTYLDIEIESAGLNVFDGETWQLVTDQDVNLQNVVRTTYDDQGTIWVATQCGSVMTYDGTKWTTVVEGATGPGCDFGDQAINGITLDPQGRVWTWSSDQVRLLNDGAWIVLTNENSDLPESGIFGLVVDNEDRVWIGSWEGVKMAKLQDAMPLPQKIVRQNRVMFFLSKLMNGMIWFFPSLIVILWLATYFNLLPGVLVAVSLGLLTVWMSLDVYGIKDLGVYATYAGVIGAVLGVLDREKRTNALWWSVILAVVGVIIVFVIGFIGYYFSHF